MFYINPPRGRAPLHMTEDCVLTRLRYLNLLFNGQTNHFDGKFEYLLEDSIHDNIGHFTLRLLVSTSPELWAYWMKRESILLKHRLENLLPRQIHRLFRNILRHSKSEHGNFQTALIKKSLITISSHFLQAEVFKHIIDSNHNKNCDKFTCEIIFKTVPDLVKNRKVDMKLGFCVIPCSMWRDVLRSLFNTLIQHEYDIFHSEMKKIVESDPRLTAMNIKVKSLFYKRLNDELSNSGTITALNINEKSKKFPLCMQHLHGVLRQSHRLSHYARFYYSLFLKKCGMSVDDAIVYWRDEYSKPHSCDSSCTHKWQANEKKFIYSIRHLYGLEGGRKNYDAPSCETIFNAVAGPRYEGGCPFKNFDDNELIKIFDSKSIETETKEILLKIRKNQPGTACGLFSKFSNGGKTNIIYSPVEYFISRNNLDDEDHSCNKRKKK